MGCSATDKTITAKGLLYGPRSTPPTARKRARQSRRAAEQEVKKGYLRSSYEQAFEALLDGDSQALGDILDNPVSTGFKQVEREEIKKFAEKTFEAAKGVGDPNQEARTVNSIQGITTLLCLNERAATLGLARQTQNQTELASSLYALDLARAQIVEKLRLDQDKIGALPLVSFGEDFSEHLLTEGEALCGQKRYNCGLGASGSAVCSPLETSVDCEDCLALYKKDSDSVSYMSQSSWLVSLSKSDLANWATVSTRTLKGRAADPQLSGEILGGYQQRIIGHINEYLEPFSDYRLTSRL